MKFKKIPTHLKAATEGSMYLTLSQKFYEWEFLMRF